jgi:hypothetical protein
MDPQEVHAASLGAVELERVRRPAHAHHIRDGSRRRACLPPRLDAPGEALDDPHRSPLAPRPPRRRHRRRGDGCGLGHEEDLDRVSSRHACRTGSSRAESTACSRRRRTVQTREQDDTSLEAGTREPCVAIQADRAQRWSPGHARIAWRRGKPSEVLRWNAIAIVRLRWRTRLLLQARWRLRLRLIASRQLRPLGSRRRDASRERREVGQVERRRSWRSSRGARAVDAPPPRLFPRSSRDHTPTRSASGTARPPSSAERP